MYSFFSRFCLWESDFFLEVPDVLFQEGINFSIHILQANIRAFVEIEQGCSFSLVFFLCLGQH